MSWTISRESARDDNIVNELAACIERANFKNILIFCSTRDRPYDRKNPEDAVLPAELPTAFAISSCDLESGKPVQKGETSLTDFYFPGQDIHVPLPKYLKPEGFETTTGSSFATALAAGLASLLLMFALFSGERMEDYKKYYVMKRVFNSMCSDKEAENVKYVRPWEHFPEDLRHEIDIKEVMLKIGKFLKHTRGFKS